MMRYRFDRMEVAGSLGDLGTLLPIAIGMVLINGLNPTGLLFSVGIFYVVAGVYFGIPVPVQPMKVIGAYAIAAALSSAQILASSALMALVLLLIGVTGAVTVIGKLIPKPVVRGVQLSTGTLLMSQGVQFIIGASKFQVLHEAAEPYLSIQHLGPVPIGIVLGVAGGLVTLLFLENRRLPAGMLVVAGGFLVGLLLGTREGLGRLSFGIYLPEFLPFGFSTNADLTFALFALVLPQVPMTLGNAVVANADLCVEYFGEDAKRATYRALTLSMALANVLSYCLGGMPLCHGAGGLAAHYRFGARTGGSNLIIGGIFLALALFLGPHALEVLHLLPMAVLGILLVFAGSQLALTVIDLKERKDLFIALMILGITLATNLGVGFIVGIAVGYLLKSERMTI